MLFVQQSQQHYLPAQNLKSLNTDHAESTKGLVGEHSKTYACKRSRKGSEELPCFLELGLLLCRPKILVFISIIVLPDVLSFSEPRLSKRQQNVCQTLLIRTIPLEWLVNNWKCDTIHHGPWLNILFSVIHREQEAPRPLRNSWLLPTVAFTALFF